MSISVKPEPVQMKNKEEEKYVACKVCCWFFYNKNYL